MRRSKFAPTVLMVFLLAFMAGLPPALGASAPKASAPASAAPLNTGFGERVVMARDIVTVSDRLVRLGDLFLNTGDKAATPVAYAPRPGKQAIFNARWLYRTARNHGLQWRPMSSDERVTVKRDSLVLARDEVEDLVAASLAEQGVDIANTKVEIVNKSFRLHLPTETSALPVIEDLALDENRGRFAAVLAVTADDDSERRVRITGRLRGMTELPVPNRRIPRGEIITAADLTWVQVENRSLQKNVILAESNLVGMAPRRGLRAGQPVHISDVNPPVLVKKGQLVTIILSTPNMMLTARGRALQNGAVGDTIRVSNIQSSLVVEATVTATGEVLVETLTASVVN